MNVLTELPHVGDDDAAMLAEVLKQCGFDDSRLDTNGVGFMSESEIRALGVSLLAGDIPGIAVVLGRANDSAAMANAVRDYQSKGLLCLLAGEAAERCADMGVRLGPGLRTLSLGEDPASAVQAMAVAVRVAQIFGPVKPGDLRGLKRCIRERIPAFVNVFGQPDATTSAIAMGAAALGFALVSEQDIGASRLPGVLASVTDGAHIVRQSLELRGIKIVPSMPSIPVAFGPAFEGEIIRGGDARVALPGRGDMACELVRTLPMDEVGDHGIEIIGPDIDAGEAGYPLAICVEVAGERMQADFEPVIERRLHTWINWMEGVTHTGLRDRCRVLIGGDAFRKGLRLSHIGEILYATLMREFGAVVDRCQVRLVTDAVEVRQVLRTLALPAYARRDERLAGLRDEDVDVFYTCTRCQSIAPGHCCVVTPERDGICGAVTWLDAAATFQLNAAGPCRPVAGAGIGDVCRGCFDSLNAAVAEATRGAVKRIALYSLLEAPTTSCGCAECVCGVEPLSGGVVIVNREYDGMTPMGMTFDELSYMTGAGAQVPGFMGLSRSFIASRRFIPADGGAARIVWMPRALKDAVARRLNVVARELYGIERFAELVADESVATDPEALMVWLWERGHPVLKLGPIL